MVDVAVEALTVPLAEQAAKQALACAEQEAVLLEGKAERLRRDAADLEAKADEYMGVDALANARSFAAAAVAQRKQAAYEALLNKMRWRRRCFLSTCVVTVA